MRTIETLYDELQTTLPPAQVTHRMTNQQEQQEAFLAGYIDEPQHTYPFLLNTNLDHTTQRVEHIGQALLNETEGTMGHAAYKETVVHSRHEIEWLKLCQQVVRQRARGETRADFSAPAHVLTSQVHGTFNFQIFNHLMTSFWSDAHSLELPHGEASAVNRRQVRDELNEMLGDIPAVTDALPTATPEVLALIQQKGAELFDGILDELPTSGPDLAPDDLHAIFSRGLPRIQLGENKETPVWTVAFDETRQAIGPEAKTNRLLIPKNRRPQPAEKLGRLVAHELWHTVRTMNGELSSEPILKYGTTGYLPIEEASAVAFEAAAGGGHRLSGEIHYVGIGFLLRGMSFRQAHEALWRYRALSSEQPPTEQDIMSYQEGAYRVLRRATAGTDHYPMHSDLSYVNGTVKAVTTLQRAISEPQEFRLLVAGRADPTNPTDRTLLKSVVK